MKMAYLVGTWRLWNRRQCHLLSRLPLSHEHAKRVPYMALSSSIVLQ